MTPLPKIVAILNVTQDSFSDGGRYIDPEAALAHARKLIQDGADVLEVGPASSNPDAELVPPSEQIARLRPVLSALTSESVPISVDATDAQVLRFALEAGAEMLNDVRGFADPALYPELAGTSADLVVVHSLLSLERATRDRATPETVLTSIDRFFERRLRELVCAGISEDRLILDPGMGFFLGSDERASLAVLRNIDELRKRFGRPIFISVSRKSFLRKITGRGLDEIGPATLTAELYAAHQGADYLRTHEPRALRDGFEILQSLEASEDGED